MASAWALYQMEVTNAQINNALATEAMSGATGLDARSRHTLALQRHILAQMQRHEWEAARDVGGAQRRRPGEEQR